MNIINRIINRYRQEPRRKSYMRAVVLMLYAVTSYLLTVMIFIGAALSEKVIIVNPMTQLSSEALKIIKLVSTTTEIFFYLAIAAIILIAYKEYQEIQFKKIIKKYGIKVIE